jgi:hypothetical protein
MIRKLVVAKLESMFNGGYTVRVVGSTTCFCYRVRYSS